MTSVLPFSHGTSKTRSSWLFRSRTHQFIKQDRIPLWRCWCGSSRCRRGSVEFESGGKGPPSPGGDSSATDRAGARGRAPETRQSCGTHGGPEGHPGIPRKRPSLQGVVTITADSSPRTFLCAQPSPTRTAPHPSEQVRLLSLFRRPSQGTGLRTGDSNPGHPA